jgi:membrane protein required for beta-lactamase induction
MTLLALLLALLAERVATRLWHLREAHWLDGYAAWVRARLAGRSGAVGHLLCASLVLLPATPVALAAAWLAEAAPAIVWLVFASLVLVFSLGPRDLGDEVDDYVDRELAGDEAAARRVAAEIIEHDAAQRRGVRAESVEDAIFVQANNRVFGVVFWFVVLGPTGLGPAAAWLFRASDLMRRSDIAAQHGATDGLGCAERVHFALAWLPARLLALGYAFAGSFEDARQGWRERYAGLPAQMLERNDWLLVHVGRAALGPLPQPGPGVPLAPRAAMRLASRALAIWLVVVALLSLTAWIA